MTQAAPKKVLIIEDDATLQIVLKDNFEFSGYHVQTASDGRKAWQALSTFAPDLVILDVMLPHVNGFELCRRIRKTNSNLPIIMLTAKGQDSDIVLGLSIGADDYVTKPFSIDVLLARVATRLRKVSSDLAGAQTITFGDCRLEASSRKLFRNNKEVPLTPKEFRLLKHLVDHPARAFSRDQLLDAVWGEDLIVTRRSVDRCVNTLRKKIELSADNPRLIVTVRDWGYRFEDAPG